MNISASAAIAYSKLNLALSIVNADVSASAAIVGSKLNLAAPGTIGSGTPAAGTFTTLQANSTFKLGTTNQGDVFYDNGTSITRLPPGTAGQALLTGGAAANPSWGQAGGILFLSNTAVTTADNTGNISISSTLYYKVIVNFGSLSAGDTFVFLFNNDSSGGDYLYAYTGYDDSGTAANGAAAGADGINMGGGAQNSAFNYSAELDIFPNVNNVAKVMGKAIYADAGSDLTIVSMAGGYNAAAPTSFRIKSAAGATFSGNVLLYRYITA